MQKKFKHAANKPAETANAGFDADMHISLLDYILSYAPDVLQAQQIMAGASALRFWQETFQPPAPGEGKRRMKEVVRWPYAERLVYLAREFLKLDERRQRYIIKAAQAQIWWRGDDLKRFQAIVAAHLDYRQLNETERLHYRKRLMSIAKTLINRHAA
jgi:hypothetical protein